MISLNSHHLCKKEKKNLQLQSRSEVLGVRTSTQEFWRGHGSAQDVHLSRSDSLWPIRKLCLSLGALLDAEESDPRSLGTK